MVTGCGGDRYAGVSVLVTGNVAVVPLDTLVDPDEMTLQLTH
jgi:hypothetical protein